MSIGLVGRKCGMTRVFTDAGVTVPVTVVEALPNRISQVKNDKADGYRAVQVTIGSRRPSRVTKALAGHFAKANVAAGYTSQEFRLNKGEGDELATGGVRNRTIENLRIVEVDAVRNLLLISGAVPGAEGGRVIVKPSVKAKGQARRQKLMPNKAPAAAKGAPAPKGAAPKAGAAKAEKK